ncbi:hypothetical protein [Bradyrhizobium sp. AUGA SZCCT0160]|uniref:hypothetical protein n=1 Tax=Bradyrhizobium sp. AUGA SZCCT0160 TaxID=2807662 RepID=UPI001BAB49C7|nr:hypothetical protein [Bradyrhizobium sp. AUGA SZCCT0160]MBR1190067.1 hypothetical protein [Bradyrhizobium sp. AUGA SZCCT0160]
MKRRIPEHVATQIRRVEPVGGDLVRLYFSVERGAAWDDQVTILMPASCISGSFDFAVQSVREITAEAAAPSATAH